jgi:predicted ferric reductase|tara:strand:- start:325 stop:822 length:498 start_codon:yes stop_codon:yes gene_type:complete
VLSADTIYFLGRWTGIVAFLLLIIDFTIMEIFRMRGGTMKEWVASRVYANKLHGISSVTILFCALLHSLLLVFGHWHDLVSSIPFWMTLGERLALMFNLGTLAAGMMVFLAFHGYFRNWFWKRWSHNSWRRIHFWTTVVLLVIVTIHAVTIGKELQFLGLTVRSV